MKRFRVGRPAALPQARASAGEDRRASARPRARHGQIVAAFVAIVALQMLLGMLSVDVLSAVRAFEHRESLWSKAQRDAYFHLWRYADTQDPLEHAQFVEALRVPLLYRRARQAMDATPPDLPAVRSALLQADGREEDHDGLIRLYRWFRDIGTMRDALVAWHQGDEAIDEMRQMAELIHGHVSRGEPLSPTLGALWVRLPQVHARIVELELTFSDRLGEAARQARVALLLVNGLVALALVSLGLLFAARVSQRHAEVDAALQAAHARWDQAARTAGLGVFEWAVTPRLLTLDERARELHGLPLDGCEPMELGPWRATVHPDDLARVLEALNRAVRDREPLVLRYRVVRGDGGDRHLEVQGSFPAERAASAEPVMLGMVRDVSEDVQAQRLRLDKEAAERANVAKSQFLSRVSHELRTPLNAVLGFSQLMQSDMREPLPPAQRGRIERVHTAGQSLLRLVDDMLDLGAIEAAGVPDEGRSDLAATVDEALAQMRPLAELAGVRMHFAGVPAGEPPWWVRGDPMRLGQVLLNLLSNAVKYNRRGGWVEVVARRLPGPSVELAVRDGGVGMDAQSQAQLFQPFNRLGAEYSAVEGSGLGLVITRELLERMGATLSVTSARGEGSAFTVTLQAVAAPVGRADGAADAPR